MRNNGANRYEIHPFTQLPIVLRWYRRYEAKKSDGIIEEHISPWTVRMKQNNRSG